MNRRAFAIVAASLFAWIASRPAVPAYDPVCDLRNLFSDPRHARAVGARYLSVHPAQASRDRLVAQIFGDREPAEFSPRHLRSFIAQRLERDFADGALVCVDGWLLARTEASLCALMVLG